MIDLGYDHYNTGSLANTPSWIRDVAFFTGTACDDYTLYLVTPDPILQNQSCYYGDYAVRPVIVVDPRSNKTIRNCLQ